MPDKDAYLREHDTFYRRGLVLGLTMAEIMVLILFTLLLALAAALATKETRMAIQEQQIAELRAREAEVGEVLRQSPAGVTVEDIIRRIERDQNDIAALQAEVARLKPFEQQGAIVEDIIRELRRGGVETVEPTKIAEELRRVRVLARENENLRGQIEQLTKQIARSGNGNEFPSCWATPDGRIESIFETTIAENGIIVTDRDLPNHAEDRTRLPVSNVQLGVVLSLGDFTQQLRPLYLWSVNERCRFYVIIFATTPEVRADLVNAVNAFFYPDSRIQVRTMN